VSKATEAALALNEAFAKCVPANQKKRLSDAEWTQSLQKFHREAKAIRQRLQLGPLSRALATYHFQKRLLQAGFDAGIVRKVVFSLVLNAFTASA
jgi:hypothetical protein